MFQLMSFFRGKCFLLEFFVIFVVDFSILAMISLWLVVSFSLFCWRGDWSHHFVLIILNFDLKDDINEEDEKLLEAFLSKESRPERTLADIILEKIKEKDAQVSSGMITN